MTVEESSRETNDQFPVGMRVLAVDDDPICLRLLETLLRKCQYHVTTTSQAITALNLLRENKNKFDLVISDVHMPDMDGFKLLELVGLEMDLPVIMLSANGDTKLVMKGITHGACDYLLKPVRIEELKNIWQHVVRRKKFDPKDQNSSDEPQHEGRGQLPMVTGDGDQNGKLNRKRKDQNEDDDGDHVDSRLNNEDPSTQKKPRVVWTVDLHRKFVAAVNQLGIDKAVPKRILDMMNVEKLTRENVASHLQKYRLYLKRISSVASQQANLVAALGSADSAYMRTNSLSGFENFPSMAGAAPFQGTSVRSIASSGMLGRLNSPAGLGMHGLCLFGMLQPDKAENLSNPIENQPKCHSSMLSGNQIENLLQGTPIALEFDHLQHKGVDHVQNPSVSTNDSVFTIYSDFSDRNRKDCSSSNSFLDVPYSSMMLQGLPLEIETKGACGNQPCSVASSIVDWPAIQPSEVQTNSFPTSEFLKQATPSDFRNTISSVPLDVGSRSCGISSITSIPAGFPDLITDLHCQAGSGISCNSEKNTSYTPKLGWNDKGCLDLSHNPTLVYDSMKSMVLPHSNNNTDFYAMGEPNLIEETDMGTMASLKSQNGYSTNNVGSLEDLVSAMMKPV